MLIRSFINCKHFVEWQEETRSITAYRHGRSLLTNKKYRNGTPAVNPINLYFAFTQSTATRALAIFALTGVKNLLISRYYFNNKFWEEVLVPYLYDPVGTCLSNPKIRKEYDFLLNVMLDKPAVNATS
jgi:hypothetical protein